MEVKKTKKKKTAETIGIMQVMEMFLTDKKATKYFESIIWNSEKHCLRCGAFNKITKQKDGFNYWCGHCRKYFNVKTGTPMENSNISLRKWAIVIYLFMTARKSISSLQLSKELDITQKSAWFMLHRLREACNAKGSKLKGIVEIDETYIGGLEKNKHSKKKTKHNQGRSTKTKAAVVGMRSRDGVVKAQVMDKVNSKNMQKFLDDNIESGSTISTDEAKFYRTVKGYEKLLVNHSVSQYVNGMASTNGIESVWAVLKRGFHGTFHHISRKHLNRYVDEFTFRLNQGNVKIDTLDRMKSVVRNMTGKRLTYKELVA